MCVKAILENGGTLKSVPDYLKDEEMCDKTAINYPNTLECLPECNETQNMCDKAVKYLSFYNKICSWMSFDSRNVW